jgi:hypothetical protein
MRLSGNTRPIICGLIFWIGITLTLPYLTFAAAHSFGGSGRFRGFTTPRQHSFLRPFNRFGWFGVGGVDDEQPVIIIQQFQSQAATEPSEPATNRIYIQPRWVDGGYGVEVLQPGYWADPKQAAER